MNSMGWKWRRLGGAASAVLFLFAALNGGCSSGSCQPVGCAYYATVNGSLNFVAEPIVVDMTVCLAHECQSASFALRTLDASTPCLTQSPGAEICLVTGETSKFELHFRGPVYQSSSVRPSTIGLKLAEHESGAVLLDESRTPTFGRDDVGDCHFECWSAEATL